MSKVLGNVLVTGANGFVGQHLCDVLLQQAELVRVSVRYDSFQNKGVELVNLGNISGETDWRSALLSIHTVVHLAARVHIMKDDSKDPLSEFRNINVKGTLNLAKQAASSGVKRFIFLSSVKVNGELTSNDQPFQESVIADPKDAYGLSKLEAEQGLLLISQQTGMEIVIIRAPLVYGAGVKANFLAMMRAVKLRVPLPFGSINNKRSLVYIGNLVSLIILCITHPAAANQIFLVSDGHDLSTTELLSECAKALNVKPMLFPLPSSYIEFAAKIVGKSSIAQRLCSSLQVDISKARTMLGWEPPFSVEQGLKATAENFRLYIT